MSLSKVACTPYVCSFSINETHSKRKINGLEKVETSETTTDFGVTNEHTSRQFSSMCLRKRYVQNSQIKRSELRAL